MSGGATRATMSVTGRPRRPETRRERDADRGDEDGGRRVVDYVRQQHRHDQEGDQRALGWQPGSGGDQQVGDRGGAPRRFQRFSHGQHRPEQNDHGPLDARVRDAQRQQSRRHHGQRGAGERHLNWQQTCHRQPDSARENAEGQDELAPSTDLEAALRQRKTAHRRQGLVDGVPCPLEQQHVPRLKGDFGHPATDSPSLARHAEHVDAVGRAELEAAGGSARESAVGLDDGLRYHDVLVAGQEPLLELTASRRLDIAASEQRLQLVGVGLDHEHVIGLELYIP